MNAVTSYSTIDNSISQGVKAWTVWASVVAFAIYLFSVLIGYSIVNPSVQRDVGLSVAQVGLLAATYTWSFATFQLFGGVLLDQFGARKIVPAGIALVTLGVFVFAQASSVTALVGAQFIIALGACVGFVGAGYVGGKWFGTAKFSFMFGMVQCLAALFSAFSLHLFSFALQNLPWREIFNWVAVTGIALFILGVLFIRDPVPVHGSKLKQGSGKFVRGIFVALTEVAKIERVLIAALYGAFSFGALLACGLLWAPKLMLARGLPQDTANLSASVLWLGLAVGCVVIPWWSDAIKRRKPPAVAGIALQLIALATLVYGSELRAVSLMVLWFVFGIGAAAHMLAFSTAGDVVRPKQIGTSAAIVNGTMFLVSGFAIAWPGVMADAESLPGQPANHALAAAAVRPLLLGLVIALVLAMVIRESYPRTGEGSS